MASSRNRCCSIKQLLMKLVYAPGVTPLPLGLTSVIFLILLFNAMTTTMVFAYLPKLVESFGVPEINAGTYVGYIASSMFIGQSLGSCFWGYLADKKGKGFTLTLSCICISLSSAAFAFTDDFWWAMVTRFIQGACGVYIASLIMLFDICDETNQPIAMTICLSAYSTGLVLGPSIGGYMVFLREQYPNLNLSKDSFLDKYKILIPNLFLFCGYTLSCIAFNMINRKRKRCQISYSDEAKKLLHDKASINNGNNSYGGTDNDEGQGDLIKRYTKSDDATTDKKKVHQASVASVLFRNKQYLLSLVINVLFNSFAIGFNELYPVWADSSRKYDGLELTISQIATTLMIAAGVLMFLQPIFLSRGSSCFGVRAMLIGSFVVQAVLYPLYPATGYIRDNTLMWALLSVLIIITRMAVGASFLGTSVLINNAVPEKYSGSANGFGNTAAGLGRVIAPTAFGRLFSWSLRNVKNVKGNSHPLGFPFNQFLSFFVMSILSVLCLLLVFFVKRNIFKPNSKPNKDDVKENTSNYESEYQTIS